MSTAINVFSYKDDTISLLADQLISRAHLHGDMQGDLSPYAVVFPGKRPAYYLRQALAEKLHGSFFPPHIYSIAEFMKHIADKKLKGYSAADPLNSAYYLFDCIKGLDMRSPVHAQDGFEHFIYWGIELYKSIDELDKWLIDNSILKGLKVALPEVPAHTAGFINNLSIIRDRFHERLVNEKKSTQGFNYITACRLIGGDLQTGLSDEFEHIYFNGLIALTKAEAHVVGKLLSADTASFYTQAAPDYELSGDTKTDGKLLDELRASLDNADINYMGPLATRPYENEMKPVYHEAVDTHSEVVSVSSILSDNTAKEGRNGLPAPVNLKPDDIAIILPAPDPLIPLLTQVMKFLGADLNITMGYPLKRTPLYALLDTIIRAQDSKKEDNSYYSVDYLKVLRHPYIKGLFEGYARILVHQIEDYLIKQHLTFLRLDELEHNGELLGATADRLITIGQKDISQEQLGNYLKDVHRLFFKVFEPGHRTTMEFAESIYAIVAYLSKFSNALDYIFSPAYISYFIELIDALKATDFSSQPMDKHRLFELFRYYTESQAIPFNGTPLKGIQIMGMLETRSLKFKKVIMFDCNEGVIPATGKYEPILPLKVKQYLKLPAYRDNEELSRYHFRRLIYGADEIHLLYKKDDASARSRFLEELIWDAEKAKKTIDVSDITYPVFSTEIKNVAHAEVRKDDHIVKTIKQIISRKLSPTAIDTYLNCPMEFYYKYVLGFREQEELEQDIEARDIGTTVHYILKEFYTPYLRKQAPAATPSELGRLGKIIEDRFTKDYRITDTGQVYLIKEITRNLLVEFVKKDLNNKPEILACETELSAKLDFGSFKATLGGRADRIDRRGDQAFIVDYKTGSKAPKPNMKKLGACKAPLKEREEMKTLIGSFQLPVYLYMYHEQIRDLNWDHLNASLFMIRDNREILLFKQGDRSDRGSFMQHILIPSLKNLISGLLDPGIPFMCDDSNEKTCGYCPFYTMCR